MIKAGDKTEKGKSDKDAFILLETAALVCISLSSDLYSSITLFPSHTPSLFDIPSVLLLFTLSFLTLSYCGFSISSVHDGELTRASFSGGLESDGDAGGSLAVHFIPVNRCPHTHTHSHRLSLCLINTHTHADTLSQGRRSRGSPRNPAANQNMTPCP